MSAENRLDRLEASLTKSLAGFLTGLRSTKKPTTGNAMTTPKTEMQIRQQIIDNIAALVERREATVDGWIHAAIREAGEVLEAVGASGVALPENWRWPLADELHGIAAIMTAEPVASVPDGWVIGKKYLTRNDSRATYVGEFPSQFPGMTHLFVCNGMARWHAANGFYQSPDPGFPHPYDVIEPINQEGDAP